jgi:hypothetical protein
VNSFPLAGVHAQAIDTSSEKLYGIGQTIYQPVYSALASCELRKIRARIHIWQTARGRGAGA